MIVDVHESGVGADAFSECVTAAVVEFFVVSDAGRGRIRPKDAVLAFDQDECAALRVLADAGLLSA